MPENAEWEAEAAPLSYLRGADVPLLDLTLSQALADTAATGFPIAKPWSSAMKACDSPGANWTAK